MAIRLTIKEVERRHPDFVKGQKWRGSLAKYKYLCQKHGEYLQSHASRHAGRGCYRCGLRANGLSTSAEYQTCARHSYYIFHPETKSIKRAYDDVPFYDGWNPRKGGSFAARAEWIIANLGKRPKGCSMHIVNHEKGFVPGNLEWTYPKKQSNQKMFKIIADLKHRIKELERRSK